MSSLGSPSQPTSIEMVDSRQLQIGWSDGSTRLYRLGELRAACPCATCREKKRAEVNKPRGMLPVLSAAEAAPLAIVQMRPVGNYAYNIAFSDGHGSGIFAFDLLQQLGQAVERKGGS